MTRRRPGRFGGEDDWARSLRHSRMACGVSIMLLAAQRRPQRNPRPCSFWFARRRRCLTLRLLVSRPFEGVWRCAEIRIHLAASAFAGLPGTSSDDYRGDPPVEVVRHISNSLLANQSELLIGISWQEQESSIPEPIAFSAYLYRECHRARLVNPA
jgi:hypothetical protein